MRSLSTIFVLLAAGFTTAQAVTPLPNTIGTQKVAVFLVNFRNSTTQPYTRTAAHNFVFGQVSSFLYENSYQQFSLSGDSFGWFTLDMDGGSCPSGITDAANKMAQAAGVNLTSYYQIVYLIEGSGCGGNSASPMATPKGVFITAGLTLKTIAHEMLHNMQVNHSQALQCVGGTLTSTCSILNYGDPYDVMAATHAGHLNSFHKERLGWMNAYQSPPLLDVKSSGLYHISPIEIADQKIKALKILKETDPTSGLKTYYYLDIRRPIGFDQAVFATIINATNLSNGVLFRTGKEGDYFSYLLDMTPGSDPWGGSRDFMDSALVVGNSYTDANAGFTVTVISADANGTTVNINFGTSTPTPTPTPASDTTAPSVSISSPSNGATVSGIIAVSASASDNVAVSKVEFYVDGVLKISDISSPYSMSLDTKLLANGSHVLMAKAYDSSSNSRSAQISVNVSNASPTPAPTPSSDTTIPTVSITSPANGAVFSPRTGITIQASASDNVKVSRVEFYVNGSLICTDTTASYSCAYKLGGAKGATYRIEARAYDSSNNMSSSVISISSSGTGGGGGGGGKRK